MASERVGGSDGAKSPAETIDYKSAGVDIDAGNEVVRHRRPRRRDPADAPGLGHIHRPNQRELLPCLLLRIVP